MKQEYTSKVASGEYSKQELEKEFFELSSKMEFFTSFA